MSKDEMREIFRLDPSPTVDVPVWCPVCTRRRVHKVNPVSLLPVEDIDCRYCESTLMEVVDALHGQAR